MSETPTSDDLLSKTSAHYNDFPFDFMTEADEAEIERQQPAPFIDYVAKHLQAADSVADIGCGPGRATLYLARLGFRVTAVDLSEQSLHLARRRAPQAAFCCASNLSLPIAGQAFNAVVSDGVIHHTPDARRSFAENVRILKEDGTLYLAVYNRRGYYYYFYTYLGIPIRWLEKFTPGRWLIYSTLLPVYYAVHLIKSRGKRTWSGAKNFFYDYIITPQATFHSREQIEDWGKQEGLSLVSYFPGPLNVHTFVFRKGKP